jgi:hypothetical protein
MSIGLHEVTFEKTLVFLFNNSQRILRDKVEPKLDKVEPKLDK